MTFDQTLYSNWNKMEAMYIKVRGFSMEKIPEIEENISKSPSRIHPE